ncbi:TPA: hypothetical protein U2B24_001602 [Streptococcus suis]|uniref:hypothetical protein n=1 Tax=Streptococcus suis TaxID=1307 RepID=UPI000CF5C827|nr:hypothetical protein [Streptococcus suis]MBS8100571.1 hypothetical protein [Streptococcus suis]MCK3871949.1 hypothetical protein [Streptococcus suis]NQK24641.1 hypothetical protein [Streptococcus suis]HEM5976628.1 hypothetical protein [Streptococcus suis]HEM6185833.1 hypothetical protein [Streptococcus suis]
MSFINQFKSQSKTVLAAVAISAATLGFAGGMSISKSSTGVSTQSRVSLAQNNSAATAASANTQDMPPGQGGVPQGMPPGQGGVPQGMPPGQGGASQGMQPGQGGPSQGTTPPDATSGATQSNSSTSSDEVNALKEKNQEIKDQISGDSSSSNQ